MHRFKHLTYGYTVSEKMLPLKLLLGTQYSLWENSTTQAVAVDTTLWLGGQLSTHHFSASTRMTFFSLLHNSIKKTASTMMIRLSSWAADLRAECPQDWGTDAAERGVRKQ